MLDRCHSEASSKKKSHQDSDISTMPVIWWNCWGPVPFHQFYKVQPFSNSGGSKDPSSRLMPSLKKKLMTSFCIQGALDASSMPCAAVIWLNLSAVTSIKTGVNKIISSFGDYIVQ